MSAKAPFGACLPEMRVRPPGPASRALADRLRAVESRNVTYVDPEWPVFWEAALGANVRDADGNVYVDLTGGFGVAFLGHAHPAVTRAVAEQTEHLVHGMGDVHPPEVKVRLLERLVSIGPWPEGRAVLASTGSEAVEIALKTALLATGKPGVLAFEGAYHGLTLGSLAVTSRALFRDPFARRLYPGVAFAPFPGRARRVPHGGATTTERASPEASLARVREILRSGAPNGDPIGAVIVEPVQGRAGVRVPPEGFMAALSELAREAEALVIADEMITGMGRSGPMLASSVVGLRPDLVCLGKALGAGMPLSACLGPPAVMDAWPSSGGEAIHTSTFLGHPLACAAALAATDVLASSEVRERTARLAARLRSRLEERLSRIPGVVEVRGIGLLLGVEFDPGEGGTPPVAARVAAEALRRGVLILPAGDAGEVLELAPPVVLTDEQADHAVEVLVSAIREVL